MSAPDIMPFDVKAYLADTTHLSNAQHGAYILILLSLWHHGGTVVDDDVTLARIAKLTTDKWRKVGPAIRALLRPAEGGRLTQKRLAIELGKATLRASKNSEAGKLGAIAKSLKRKKPPPATAAGEQPVRHSDDPKAAPSAPRSVGSSKILDSDSNKEDRKTERKKESESARARARPLPPDWALSPSTRKYAEEHGFAGAAADGLAEAFCDHHRHKRTIGHDWDAGWRQWVRNEIKLYGYKRFGGAGNPGQGAGAPPNGTGKITPADLASGRYRRTP